MIIAIEYYVGEMGFDDMLNSGYMIVNSYAAESDLLITPAGHIDSKSSTLLKGAYRVAIFNATVSNNEGTYAIILIRNDGNNFFNGFQIINVTDPLYPKVVSTVRHPPGGADDPKYVRTSYPNSVETFTLDGKVYAVVTNDDSGSSAGIQIIDVTNPTLPGDAGNVTQTDGDTSYLNGPQGLDIFNIGNYPYAIIANYYHGGGGEFEVTMINMTEPSSIMGDDLYHIDDKPKLVLARANDVDTFKIGTDTYAIVASRGDNGTQIIDVTNPDAPVIKGNLTDTSQSELKYASGVDTIKIGTDTYAIVTSGGYDNIDGYTFPSNIQIINVTNPDNPEAKGTLNENSVSVLNEPYGVETFTLDGSAYAIVASRGNNTTPGGIQIIDMSDPDNPAAKGNATYDESKYPILNKANGVAIFNATVGGNKETYAIVTSEGKKVSGVQIVRITNSDTTKPTLIEPLPTLDPNSHTLSFYFDETIDVSEIERSDITINYANGTSLTSLVHFNLPSVDSSTFKIELTGPVYRSILEAVASGNDMRIAAPATAIRDFAGNPLAKPINEELIVADRADTDLLIIPAASITTNSTVALKDAYGVDIFYVDDNPYAVVTSRVNNDDGGIQIINMTDPYYPIALANVTNTDGNPTVLRDARGVDTFEINDNPYAVVTSRGDGDDDGGFQIIDVRAPNAPVVKGNGTDGDVYDLDGASGVDTFEIGTDMYAIIANRGDGDHDGGFQIIDVTNPGSPSHKSSGINGTNSYNELGGASGVAVFAALSGSGHTETETYAIIASSDDDGFQIIHVGNPGSPLAIGSGTDGSVYDELRGASGVKTFEIGTDKYAIIASKDDHGFQIIDVTTAGGLLAAGSGTDNTDGYNELRGASGVDTFEIGTDMYAIIASKDDHGVQIINMTDPDMPSAAGSLSDNNALVLKASHDVATFNAGCHTYAIATSRGDDGIQIMELTRKLTPPVITLDGSNPQTISLGDQYVDLGATTDDGSEVTPDLLEVPTNEIGTYYVTYDSVDSSCNAATPVTRTVKVVSPITLTPAGHASHNEDNYSELYGAYGVDIFTRMEGEMKKTYAIVASRGGNNGVGSGFQIINVTDPYHPLPVGNGTDKYSNNDSLYTELLGASGVDTFNITIGMETKTYAIIASKNDDGFQIINITTPKNPSPASSKTDGSVYNELDGASGVKTFTRMEGEEKKMYAIIASEGDDGFQIIDVTDPGSPLAAGSGTDGNSYDELLGASGVDTFEIGTKTYAIVASVVDDGFQIINMTDPGSPSPAGSGTDKDDSDPEDDSPYQELDGASGVKTFTRLNDMGTNNTYAIIASKADGGFQIIDVTDPKNPSPAGSGTDKDDSDPEDDSPYTELQGASGVDTFNITIGMETKTYAIIASVRDDGFQIINMTDPGSPSIAGSGTDKHSSNDSPYQELDGASGVDTFEIGPYTYAIIASKDDNGVQMIRITGSDVIRPSLHDPTPDLDLASGTLTFDFSEAIDVSSINATQIEIKDKDSNLITNLKGSLPPDTDSHEFAITLTGAQYKSILVAIANEKGPLEITNEKVSLKITVGEAAIPDFYSNYAEKFTVSLTVVNMPKPGDFFIIPVGNGTDGSVYNELRGASGVKTFTRLNDMGTNNTYAIIASKADSGFQIINVTDPYYPSPAGSGTDGDVYDLNGASGVDTFEINTNTYAIIASVRDDGFQIINVTDPYYPSPAGSGTDNDGLGDDDSPYTELQGASGVDTFTRTNDDNRNSTYAIIASKNDDGFQIINVTDPKNPSPAGSGTDGDSNYEALDGASGVDIFTRMVGGAEKTYAIIASVIDGFQIINVTTPDMPSAAGHDFGYDELNNDDISANYTGLDGARSVDTIKIGINTYAIIASGLGDISLYSGFQIINVTDPYYPSPAGYGTDNDDDSPYTELSGARGVTTFTRTNDDNTNSTYAIIASEDDDGIQIINMTDPYYPSAAGHFPDNLSTLFKGAFGVDTFEIDYHMYAIITASDDDSFLIVELRSDLTSPVITSILRQDPRNEQTNDTTPTFRITFDEAVTGVTAAAFTTADGAGAAGVQSIAVAKASDDDDVYDVTVTTISDGTVSLDVDANNDIADRAGNALINLIPTGDNETFTVDRTLDTTPPTIDSIIRQDPRNEQTNDTTPTFRITFDEAVTGVTAAAFTTADGAGAAGVQSIAVAKASDDDDVYDVTVTTISDGTVSLDVDANNDIADRAGNALINLIPTGDNETFTVDRTLDTTPPTIDSIIRQDPRNEQTNDTTPTFRITFDEAVTGVTAAAFTTADGAGAAGVQSIAVAKASDDDDVYDVTVTTISDGTVSLDVDANNDIADRAGNALINLIPTGDNETFTVDRTLDTTPPTIDSIIRQDPRNEQTNDTTPTFRITFDEAVTGVTAAAFTTADGAIIATVASVNGEEYDDKYDVTVTAIDFDGIVSLSVAENNDIADRAGNALINLIPTGDNETFTVVRTLDTTPPTIDSIIRQDPRNEQTNDTTPTFRITFDEAVTGVTAAAFTTADGAIIATVASVNGEEYDDKYDVTVTAIDFDGIVSLSVAENNDIADRAGNALINLIPTGDNETFTVVRTLDTTPPTIDSIIRQDPRNEQTNDTTPTFRITFDEAVTGVTAAAFTTADGAIIATVTSVNGEEYDDKYDVTVTAIDFDGIVSLSVAENNDIADRAGNALINLIPTGDNETFTVVRDIVTPPSPGGGSSGGGGGGGNDPIRIDNVYIKSVSWDCNAGTIKIIAGPDSDYLSISVRTTQLGVHQASMAGDDIPGYRAFVSNMDKTEDYIGIKAVAPHGRDSTTISESINITECTGERTFDEYMQPESTLPSAVTQTEEEGAATQRTEDTPVTEGQETIFDSPLYQQLKGDIPAEMVQCNEGLVLVLKPNMEESACVKESTAHKLVMRGWHGMS